MSRMSILRPSAVIAVLSVAALFWVVTTHNPGGDSDDQASTTTETMSAPTQTTSAPPAPSATIPPKLTKRVQGFVAAFYSSRHNDTEAFRRELVKRYTSGNLLKTLNLAPGAGLSTEENFARVQQKLNLSGVAPRSEIRAEYGPSKNTRVVTAVVKLKVTNPGGEVVANSTQPVVMVWGYHVTTKKYKVRVTKNGRYRWKVVKKKIGRWLLYQVNNG